MMLHFMNYGRGSAPATFLDRQVERIALSGWIGVDLFFVLSGFLITGILYSTKLNAHYFRNFYIRRFLRIFPLYYGFLFAFIFTLPILDLAGAKIQSQFREQIWYWSYLINWRIGLNDWPQYYGIAHFWSLAIEEQFYLVWPTIIFLFSRKKLILICCLLFLASPIFRFIMTKTGYELAYVLTFSRMDALALGSLISLVVQDVRGLTRLKQLVWPSFFVTSAMLLVIFVWKRRLEIEDDQVFIFGLSIIALFWGSILIFGLITQPERGIGKIFSSRPLVFFGKYSYALYVFHHLVAIYLPVYGFSIGSIPTLRGSQLPGFVVFSLIATIISVALALASWHFWEVHFLRLKKLFEYSRSHAQE